MRQSLVTGANRGLGLALVRELLLQGAQVVACCRDPAGADELQALRAKHDEQLHVEALELDDAAAVAAFPDRLALHLRRLDLLIHNAGVLVSGERFGNVKSDDLQHSYAVNAVAPLLLTQSLTGLLHRGRMPCVLCVSSQLGSIAQSADFRTVSYAMSKAALNMAVKRLHAALSGHGITVLAVHPGWLQTRMGGTNASLGADQSARMLLELVDRSGPGEGGRFVAYDGSPLPW